SVHPGRVDTDMQHELRAAEQGTYEAEQYLRPATVAAAIGFVLRAPEDAVVTSLDLRPRAIGRRGAADGDGPGPARPTGRPGPGPARGNQGGPTCSRASRRGRRPCGTRQPRWSSRWPTSSAARPT